MNTQVCKQVCMCVQDVLRVQWNLVFIGVEWSCRPLFIGAFIAFTDKYRFIDNDR